ncbi:hypothetical protein C8Q79DRAFT_116034 [Trametes meyenii]|nr:hypothetical protein C8Q79DRAFT_116034 [Trametes meyenii]
MSCVPLLSPQEHRHHRRTRTTATPRLQCDTAMIAERYVRTHLECSEEHLCDDPRPYQVCGVTNKCHRALVLSEGIAHGRIPSLTPLGRWLTKVVREPYRRDLHTGKDVTGQEESQRGRGRAWLAGCVTVKDLDGCRTDAGPVCVRRPSGCLQPAWAIELGFGGLGRRIAYRMWARGCRRTVHVLLCASAPRSSSLEGTDVSVTQREAG